MKTHTAVAALFVSLIAGTAAHAATVVANFSFNSPLGNLGTTETYTNNGITITAAGFNGISTTSTNPATALYGNPTGLGLANDYYGPNGTYEIPNNEFVQIDISGIPASYAIQFQMTNVEVGWRIFGSNTSGVFGTLLQSGSNETMTSLTSAARSYKYIDVIAAANCETQLQNLQVTSPTPEPATSALMGVALVGMGIVVKKMRRRG